MGKVTYLQRPTCGESAGKRWRHADARAQVERGTEGHRAPLLTFRVRGGANVTKTLEEEYPKPGIEVQCGFSGYR